MRIEATATCACNCAVKPNFFDLLHVKVRVRVKVRVCLSTVKLAGSSEILPVGCSQTTIPNTFQNENK